MDASGPSKIDLYLLTIFWSSGFSWDSPHFLFVFRASPQNIIAFLAYVRPFDSTFLTSLTASAASQRKTYFPGLGCLPPPWSSHYFEEVQACIPPIFFYSLLKSSEYRMSRMFKSIQLIMERNTSILFGSVRMKLLYHWSWFDLHNCRQKITNKVVRYWLGNYRLWKPLSHNCLIDPSIRPRFYKRSLELYIERF